MSLPGTPALLNENSWAGEDSLVQIVGQGTGTPLFQGKTEKKVWNEASMLSKRGEMEEVVAEKVVRGVCSHSWESRAPGPTRWLS
jgi:hypothetical protein